MAALHNPGLRRGVVITLSLVAAHFMAYTFVRPLLETRAGFAGDWIGPLLFAYGVAGVAGNFVAGLGAARRERPVLLAIVAALALVLTLHAWLGDRPLAAGVLLLAWGLAYGGVSVALQLWMLRAAPDAVEPATAWFVSAFNLGIAAGSLLGVPTVDALGLRANLLLAASCLVPAIAALLWPRGGRHAQGAPPRRSTVSYNPAMARGRSARRHRNRYMSVIASQDVHVDTAKGRLYARRWDPAGAAGAPIVLFHDSLGCVALWRDFPEQLASETGRSVVAYDRLGFGLSDPNPATLVRGFIEEEADGDFARLRDALDIGPFVAFGHSVGGGMAVNVAARHASDCRALITESAQAFAEDRTVAGVADAKRGFAEPGQLDRLKKYHGEKPPGCWAPGSTTGSRPHSPTGPWTRHCARCVARCWRCMGKWTSMARPRTPSASPR